MKFLGKALAAEFKEVSLHLRAMLESSEDKTSQIGQLTQQRDDVILRIRELLDFSRFLLPPLFSDLRHAAEHGAVIIVNSSQYSCDAMIILSAEDPVHIPLQDIVQADVLELSKEFQSLIKNAGSSDNQLNEIVGVLCKLWECVVSPIVEALRHLAQPGSRIWWCPTAEFALLPLHAAGPYVKESYNFSSFYVSSYTPTLAALIRARQQIAQDASTLQFVAIGQGNPDEGKALPHVASEVDDVARRVTPILPFTSLMDSDATVQRALDALNAHQWVHLACHGMPNREKPFESSFMMRDGPLTITDIIRPRLHTPEFTFLSACHTTVGYESSPDESIHLAAAMQFSGFRSVIGSMWSVDDEVVGQIVSTFYDNMVDGSGKLDCRRAAVALHKAVKKLRKKIPLEQQIVLVHIGV
jgi:CHAT domain-containing protein